MKADMHVEFTARSGAQEFKEESVCFRSAEELYRYVSPGGGCEHIPDEVTEVQMILLSHAPGQAADSPLDEALTTLELGMVFLTGPLSEVVQVSQQLLGKASRGELAEAFLRIAGVSR